MLNEETQKLFDAKGAQCERLKRLLRRRRERMLRIMRELWLREKQAEAALMAARTEDE